MNDRSIEMINNIKFDSKTSNNRKKRFRIDFTTKAQTKRIFNTNEFDDENDENDESQNIIDEILNSIIVQIQNI